MDVLAPKNFSSRDDLDNYVINQYGKTTDSKLAQISGTKKELARLNLRHGSLVWGVVAVETDFVEKTISSRPNRGKIYKSKLNGQVIKTKNAKTNKSSAGKKGATTHP